MTFGNAYSFAYSLAGAVLSLGAMAGLKKLGRFSPLGGRSRLSNQERTMDKATRSAYRAIFLLIANLLTRAGIKRR